MKENYNYPLNPEWTTEELILVVNLWGILEAAYEKKVTAEDFLKNYTEFKTVVKSIGEERELGRDFEEASGYSLYHVVKQAKIQKTGILKRKDFDK
ncbi:MULTISPECIES: UPF0223 family protein [Vagococcus]|uniref:Uncharacterized protein n=1 Tax=Vagococcus fluvialis bH819 TaxID=1255619 RepID=A0A1X6WQH0_9ENTE|nr:MULTISPECIES: UPF0223 family protein [Vagococcus]SLM85896.1 hypothetical protein FM121_07325 [Vagococcus fluvialis bH819]HCM88263.1 hypothetical protein [Vagococcus sp.]